MVYEVALLRIQDGKEAEFEAAARQAIALFRRAKGCSAMALNRSVEHPSQYRLVVKWATLENHMVDFRESADFHEWRALVGPYFAAPPEVQHLTEVFCGF